MTAQARNRYGAVWSCIKWKVQQRWIWSENKNWEPSGAGSERRGWADRGRIRGRATGWPLIGEIRSDFEYYIEWWVTYIQMMTRRRTGSKGIGRSSWTVRTQIRTIIRSSPRVPRRWHLSLSISPIRCGTSPTVPIINNPVYFVLICILQTIPGISVTNGKPTTVFPLAFVLLTVLVKDAYEEFCRYQKDSEENNRPTEILTERGFQ